jgi:Sulfotransferase domain
VLLTRIVREIRLRPLRPQAEAVAPVFPAQGHAAPAKVIINSVPKSGTYMLTKLIGALGCFPTQKELHLNDPHCSVGTRANGRLRVHRIPSPRNMDMLKSGHSCPAHLTWSSAAEQKLTSENIRMLFIYRDPRDIVISYAKFAMYSEIYRHETPGHNAYYNVLKALENDQRRTEDVIINKLPIFQFFENAPWLYSTACLPVQFEAIYSDIMLLERGEIGHTLRRILVYLGMVTLPCTPEEFFAAVHNKSKTAMGGRGKVGVWRSFYDERLHKVAKNPLLRAVATLYGYPEK